MDALTALIHEDATQSMPPYDLWLSGRDDILRWWVGPGAGCRGSRVIPTTAANGAPAFGQYKPSERGEGYEPWALQVLELAGRPDRRAHVLPRHRDACSRSSACRSGSTRRRELEQRHSGRTSREPMNARAGRAARGVAMPQPTAAAVAGARELQPRERVDRDGVGRRRRSRRRRATSAPLSLEQLADAVAEPGQVGARDRPAIANAIVCGADGHRDTDRRHGANSSVGEPMSSAARARSDHLR